MVKQKADRGFAWFTLCAVGVGACGAIVSAVTCDFVAGVMTVLGGMALMGLGAAVVGSVHTLRS